MSDVETVKFQLAMELTIEPSDVVDGLHQNDLMIRNFITQVLELAGSSDLEAEVEQWLCDRREDRNNQHLSRENG